MKNVTTDNLRRSNRVEPRLRWRVLALIFAAFFVCGASLAESIYRLDATTSTGVDLTAMEGYYADRMEGPSSANIEFSGPLTVDPSVSESNPFQLIGNGKQIKVTASGSGFHSLPLKMYNAAGKTGTSTLLINAGGAYSGGSLDVGKYNTFQYGYVSSGNCYLDSSRVNVHDGGKIKCYGLAFGRNRNLHMSVTNGASIEASYYVQIGRQSKALDSPLTAFLGISNATFNAGATLDVSNGKAFTLMFNVATSDNATENCRVVLGPGGVLEAVMVFHHGGGRSAIVFDGGKYKATGTSASALFYTYGYTFSNTWVEPHIIVQGINGNPIDVEISTDRMLASGADGNGRRVYLTGDGGFVKRGAGTLLFTRKGLATCDYTGPTTIYGGGIVVTNSVFKPGRGELTVASGAFLDLNGFDVEFSGAVGDGVVSNGSDRASTLALGWNDADSQFDIAVSNDVSIVKTGTGTLTVGPRAADYAGSLSVSDGTVRVSSGVSLSPASLTVAQGAVLDAQGTLSLSSLTMDYAAGASHIANFAPTAGGTLEIVNFPAGGAYELPVAVDALDDANGNLATWSVVIDGKAKNHKVAVENGALCLLPPGMTIVIR